jgi:hypothetical protein
MTEEKFNEIIKIKEEIAKLEFNLKTIDYLIDSDKLTIEVNGVSTCEFKVHRHLFLTDQEVIRHSLFTEKVSINDRLYKLKKEFEKL